MTKRLRNKGRQARQVLSVNGRVKVVRRWWHSVETGSMAPVDEMLDPQLSSVSVGVREMACRLNNDAGSFDRAAENLARTALVAMSGEQLRLLTVAAGRAVLAAQQAETIPPAFQASECVVDPRARERVTRIYNGVDGVLIPLITEVEKAARRKKVREKRQRSGKKCRALPPRKRGADRSYKEFKAIAFYDEHGAHWHEALSRRPRKQIGALVRREARRLGFAQAREKIANVDGASWIRAQLTERPDQLPLDGLGLDFYHLSENIHRCRRSVFGEKNPAGVEWAGDLLHVLKHEGYAPAWDRLTVWRAGLHSQKKKQAADRLLNYISERREMIEYPEFRRRGWQIGSGPTESRCKTSTQRLKGRGRRWDAPHAEAVAALTTLQDSGQWQLYWKIPQPTKT